MSKVISVHKKTDMQAAEKVMRARLDAMHKHIVGEDWAAVCADLRAIESECINASRMAAALSFHAEKQRWSSSR